VTKKEYTKLKDQLYSCFNSVDGSPTFEPEGAAMIEPTLNALPGTVIPGSTLTKEFLEKKLEAAFKSWEPLNPECKFPTIGGVPLLGFKKSWIK
jgi:hypothetical protein